SRPHDRDGELAVAVGEGPRPGFAGHVFDAVRTAHERDELARAVLVGAGEPREEPVVRAVAGEEPEVPVLEVDGIEERAEARPVTFVGTADDQRPVVTDRRDAQRLLNHRSRDPRASACRTTRRRGARPRRARLVPRRGGWRRSPPPGAPRT